LQKLDPLYSLKGVVWGWKILILNSYLFVTSHTPNPPTGYLELLVNFTRSKFIEICGRCWRKRGEWDVKNQGSKNTYDVIYPDF
jgi:hypothetical protein